MSLSPILKRNAWIAKEPISQPEKEPHALDQPDPILLDCIDSVLTEVLGVKVREAIYDHLARHTSLAKEEIPAHLDEFSQLLKNTFGRGAATLEKRIARKLYSAFGCEFVDVPKFGLQGYISLMTGIIARKNRKVVA